MGMFRHKSLEILMMMSGWMSAMTVHAGDHGTQWDTHFVSSQLVVESRSGGAEVRRLDELTEELRKLRAHPFFDRLPPIGVLVDGEWKRSAGFFSVETKNRQGDPALVLAASVLANPSASRGLMAHELTHALHAQFRPYEEGWVREGIALLGEWRVTGDYSPVLFEGFARPETSLTEGLSPWDEGFADRSLRTAQYGHVLQYFVYIYRLCGKDALGERLLTSPSKATGVAFVDEVLRESGSTREVCRGFAESFDAFSRARFISHPTRAEDFILPTSLRSPVRDAPAVRLPAWSAQAYRPKPGDRCQGSDQFVDGAFCLNIRHE